MVKVCVVGCLHGELNQMYKDIQATEAKFNFKTDIVLCCGDFQSLRNPADLKSMSVPPKYYAIGDFYKYYAEEVTAPILTLFVGGNHEASAYLQELPYGGWVAPNIYYMGYAGVVQFAGLRIGGLSGIYKSHDYNMGHYEHPPYNEMTKRSAYHTRNFEVFRLSQIRRRVDIMLSHDWPRGIYHYGDLERLCRYKRHFREEIDQNVLGSLPAEHLVCYLQPRYWFAAHLHCKFSALVQHSEDTSALTRFLALNKCLKNKDYIQFLDIEPDPRVKYMKPWDDWQHDCHPSDPIMVDETAEEDDNEEEEDGSGNADTDKSNIQKYKLCLDPEWMSILKSTDDLFSISKVPCILPDGANGEKFDYSSNDDNIASLWDAFGGHFIMPENFEPTSPQFKPSEHLAYLTAESSDAEINSALSVSELVKLSELPAVYGRQPFFTNPQTELLCAMLELTDPNAVFLGQSSYNLNEMNNRINSDAYENEDDMNDDDEDSCGDHGEDTGNYNPSLVSNYDQSVSGISYEPDQCHSPDLSYQPQNSSSPQPMVAYDPGSVEPIKSVNPELIELPDDDNDDELVKKDEVESKLQIEQSNNQHLTSTPKCTSVKKDTSGPIENPEMIDLPASDDEDEEEKEAISKPITSKAESPGTEKSVSKTENVVIPSMGESPTDIPVNKS